MCVHVKDSHCLQTIETCFFFFFEDKKLFVVKDVSYCMGIEYCTCGLVLITEIQKILLIIAVHFKNLYKVQKQSKVLCGLYSLNIIYTVAS